jgi:SAM-dependent methyltransferase
LKRVTPKTSREIGIEWDAIAPKRDAQILSGRDISYNYVLKPMIMRLVGSANLDAVLDLGCGTGQLTALLASRAGHVTGLDVSAESIDIAKRNTAGHRNVTLVHAALDEFSRSEARVFSLVTANMSLSTMPNLEAALASIGRLLVPGGHLVASVPHPCSWPHYWGYSTADWFDYWSEMSIEAEFKISLERSGVTTTHVHRPLLAYLNALVNLDFAIEVVDEPPPPAIAGKSDSGPNSYPRFLAWRARLHGQGGSKSGGGCDG